MGEFKHRGFARKPALQMWCNYAVGLRPEHLGGVVPHRIGKAAGHDRTHAAVGEGVDLIRAHMGDMGRHHFGGEAGARLHGSELALGLFQCGDGGFQLAVGAGKLFGAGEQLV